MIEAIVRCLLFGEVKEEESKSQGSEESANKRRRGSVRAPLRVRAPGWGDEPASEAMTHARIALSRPAQPETRGHGPHCAARDWLGVQIVAPPKRSRKRLPGRRDWFRALTSGGCGGGGVTGLAQAKGGLADGGARGLSPTKQHAEKDEGSLTN